MNIKNVPTDLWGRVLASWISLRYKGGKGIAAPEIGCGGVDLPLFRSTVSYAIELSKTKQLLFLCIKFVLGYDTHVKQFLQFL